MVWGENLGAQVCDNDGLNDSRHLVSVQLASLASSFK